jgi:hypothetical protein
MVKELTADQVRLKCDPSMFNCEFTRDLSPYEGIIGQGPARQQRNSKEMGIDCLR